MKNIGYVLSEFPVFSETFVGTEMRAMEKKGYNIVPFAFKNNLNLGQSADQTLAQKTIRIGEVPRGTAMFEAVSCFPGWKNAMSFVLAQQGLPKASLFLQGLRLAHLARKENINHFHAHFALNSTSTAIVAAKLLRKTVSFVGHGYDIYASPSDLPLKLRTADFSIAVCKHMQSHFKSMAPNKDSHLVECGIEMLRYLFSPIATPVQRILFIGRLTEKKGLSALLDAMALMPASTRPILDIVGEGHLKQQLAKQAEDLQLSADIKFLGAQPSQWIIRNASKYLALVAPFCEAPNGDRDTGPVVVKEAMALGLPVICSRFMGCEEMISQSSGYLVAPNNPSKLAHAIKSAQHLSPKERLTMLKIARKRVGRLYATDITSVKLSAAIENSHA